MIDNEYSFFSLTALSSISIINNDFSIEFENKIWKLTNNGKNLVGANVFKLFWIDLLSYNGNKKIYGQIDEVEVWFISNTSILVFTSSFSIVNLVRHFLNVELKLATKINSYTKSKLMNVLSRNASASVFVIASGDIIKIDKSQIEQFEGDSIFAVEYFDALNKVVVFISTHGMVKLSYGASELVVKKVCDILGLNI